MPQELLDLLARLGELNKDEVADLERRLVEYFDQLDKDGVTPANVELMGEVASAIDNVRAEQGGRAQAEAEASAAAEELRRKIHPAKGEGEGAEGDKGDKGDKGAGGDKGAEGEPAAPAAPAAPTSAGDPAAVPIAAAAQPRPTLGELSANRSPLNAPRLGRTGQRSNSRVRAMAAVGGKSVGQTIETREDLARAVFDRVRSLGVGRGGTGERLLVARAEVDYPEDRQLGGDPFENTAKMERVVGQQALVASGGICAPVDVDFSILVVSDDAEPIAADLPTFNATRGGIRFIKPPTFWSVGSAGTTYWTEANDANPGSNGPATKPVQTIQCGQEVEVLVDAIPTILRFGNLMNRFSPEVVDANTQLALANAARVREVHRLGVIASYSTSVSSSSLLGAARDFLSTVDQVAAAYRRRHRIGRNSVQMRAILPDYMIDMVRADLTRELAHGDDSNLSLTDADVTALLQSRGVAVTWTMDSQGAGQSGFANGGSGLAYPDQTLAALQGQGAILQWPTTVVWYMFAEGTFQRLDGGTLDLGVVRDSVLDSTNDYETFVETFEGIAMRGVESLQVVSQLIPNGASAGWVQTAASPNILTA